MSSAPHVTILMPTYNGDLDYLAEAFDSAHRTGAPILVVDDASPDRRIAPVLDAWEARGATVVRRSKNLGLFGNLNDGLARVTTTHAVILCGDDRLREGALDVVEDLIARFPDVDVFVNEFVSMDPAGRVVGREHGEFLDHISRETRPLTSDEALRAVVAHGSFNGNITGMVLRIAGVRVLPPFRESWVHAADWAYLVDVARQGRLGVGRTPIADVRWHPGNLSGVNHRSGRSLDEVARVIGELSRDARVVGELRALLDERATYVVRMSVLHPTLWPIALRALRRERIGIARALRHSTRMWARDKVRRWQR